jgi:tetratricopeptide (TPR) repeat protein
MSEEEIEQARHQIQIHTAKLHISSQLINLQVTHLGPKLANQDLLDQMEKLQSSINEQGSSIDGTLIECAQDYLSSGSTLYEGSVASGPSRRFDSANGNAPQIVDWISTMNGLRLDDNGPLSHEGVHDSSAIVEDTGSNHRRSATGSEESAEYREDASEADTEFEDELAVDSAAAALESGNAAFEQNDYEEADALLQEALTLIHALPRRLRNSYNEFDIQCKLAVSAFHLYDSTTAEASLAAVVEQQHNAHDDAHILCVASHLLAQIYVRNRKLDLARTTCENTYRSRRRAFGKDHESCHESLALLARICELQKNISRAKVYLSMVPTQSQERMRRAFENLDAESQGRSLSTGSVDTVSTIRSLNRDSGTVAAPPVVVVTSPAASITKTKFADGGVVLQSRRACDLAWSKNGRYLACADRVAKEIKIVGSSSEAPKGTIRVTGLKSIYSLALSPSGTYLAIGYEDASIELWHTETSVMRKRLAGRVVRHHKEAVGSIEFSPNGEMLVSMCKAGRILFFDTNANQLKQFVVDADCYGTEGTIAFSPNGSLVAITSAKGANVYDTSSGALQRTIVSHIAGSRGLGGSHSLVGLSFCPDGLSIAMGSGTSEIGIYKVDGSGDYFALEILGVKRPDLCFMKFAHTSSGHLIAAQLPPYFEEKPWICDAASGRFETLDAPFPYGPSNIALSLNGAFLAISTDNGDTKVLDLSKRLSLGR